MQIIFCAIFYRRMRFSMCVFFLLFFCHQKLGAPMPMPKELRDATMVILGVKMGLHSVE